ncbi:hypothetical protein TRM7557_02456 [Tritonibacter multivorans]|uniref:Translocase n=1 Tax=Tritonibacter multivorans TaxID=928856 RepID=A0A0P1GEA4_9RHOB|nr:hypothetical protein [Tritonibacter multivorans]MDA7420034.1 hypothetical protein [Tritonibacter multivorans]CUH79558.1 hypothetical protein TRM7557_02456 [Tritonibacter multivorans]SFC07262.1 hypothetical protein SAMN04488049_101262 [Tritonibacter multivorans]
MLSRSTALTIAATSVAVLGIGLFMQKSGPDTPPVAGAESAAILDVSPLKLENITYTSLSHAVLEEAEVPVCATSMTAVPQAGAMVQLSLSAPCDANGNVTFHHAGMMFAQRLDDHGQLELAVPAMTKTAVFLAELASGETLMASAEVSDMADYERIAVQAEDHGVGLHAFEYGAEFGGAGHIWSQAEDGAGQFLKLGDASLPSAQFLQIYSHAVPKLRAEGEIALSLEAEVRSTTCNRPLNVQILSARGGGLRARELSLEMPACDAVGDFLVLNNPVESLKLSRN